MAKIWGSIPPYWTFFPLVPFKGPLVIPLRNLPSESIFGLRFVRAYLATARLLRPKMVVERPISAFNLP